LGGSEGAIAGRAGRVMELVLLARAEAEVLTMQARMEETLEGLGDRFNQRVEETLDQLLDFPQSGPVFVGSFRRILVRDFPVGIFYSIEGRRLIVQAVLDLRQNRESIERKLRET
jgi:hypothetical protein